MVLNTMIPKRKRFGHQLWSNRLKLATNRVKTIWIFLNFQIKLTSNNWTVKTISKGLCEGVYHAGTILWCVTEKNFLSCPSTMITDSSEFEKVKKFLETEDKCGTQYDDFFLIHVTFWFVIDNSTETTAKTEPWFRYYLFNYCGCYQKFAAIKSLCAIWFSALFWNDWNVWNLKFEIKLSKLWKTLTFHYNSIISNTFNIFLKFLYKSSFK